MAAFTAASGIVPSEFAFKSQYDDSQIATSSFRVLKVLAKVLGVVFLGALGCVC